MSMDLQPSIPIPFSHKKIILILRTLLILTAWAVFSYQPETAAKLYGHVLFLLFGASSLGLLLVNKEHFRRTRFTMALVLSDTLLVSFLLYTSGAGNYGVLILFFFMILLAAVGQSLKATMVAGILACVGYALFRIQLTSLDSFLSRPDLLLAMPLLLIASLFYGYTVDENKSLQEAVLNYSKQQELLARKNRDLETLLFVTSHDLREPLRAISNFSRLVHERYADRLDAKGKDFLTRVVRAAQRLDTLLSDVLSLSRAQRLEPPKEEIDGQGIVRTALARREEKVQQSGAAVRIAEDLPRLRVDKVWATQAIYNLLANALKFTRNGEPPDIEVAPYTRNGEAGIVVRDRGPGVVPEHAERIFQLFQRAVGHEVDGTGAGLAIVREVAERHGGRAWVQPRAGGGAEFVVTFGNQALKGGI